MPHLVLGLILVALGVWGVVAWWGLFGLVMRGVVPFVLLVTGLVAILAGARRGGIGRPEGADFFDGEPQQAGPGEPAAGEKAN